jgi:hypothetical protein
MVALTILSVVLMALGGLMFQVARQTRGSAATTYRSAAMQRAAAYVQGLPWTGIDPAIGCRADSSGQLEYNRCISVMDSTPRLKRITVVISPTGVLTALPDTLVVYRYRGRPDSPLR